MTSDDAVDESLGDRIAALKDVIPPTYRKNMSTAATTGMRWVQNGLSFGGKTLWVVSTSALLLGVPWALAFSEEQQVQEMEREMRMQQNANEVWQHYEDNWHCWWKSRLTFGVTAPHARHGCRTSWCKACAIIAFPLTPSVYYGGNFCFVYHSLYSESHKEIGPQRTVITLRCLHRYPRA